LRRFCELKFRLLLLLIIVERWRINSTNWWANMACLKWRNRERWALSNSNSLLFLFDLDPLHADQARAAVSSRRFAELCEDEEFPAWVWQERGLGSVWRIFRRHWQRTLWLQVDDANYCNWWEVSEESCQWTQIQKCAQER
jgi:hypothetical protein